MEAVESLRQQPMDCKVAMSLSSCARAWSDVQEDVRVAKMRPAPKPVEVPAPGKRKRKASVQGADLVPMPQVAKPPVLQPPTDGH